MIVTINGVPTFPIAPLGEDDDLINRPIVQNPEFRAVLEERAWEGTVSLDKRGRCLGS